MPFYMLQLSAELDNLTALQLQGGCDDPNYTYYFKLRCENCGEVTQKNTCLSLNETVRLPNGRDTAHLVQKCKFCGREGNITMITGWGEPLLLETSLSQKSANLMLFDCRGFEPVEFTFAEGWKAESIWGTTFEIDPSEGDFADYDDKGQLPVAATNFKGSFKVAHKIATGSRVKYVT